MTDSEFNEEDFYRWLDAGGAQSGEGALRVTRSGVPDETWDLGVLERDIRAVAVEYLVLAASYHPLTFGIRRTLKPLTTIAVLASQPPLYGQFVTEQALQLLSLFALHETIHGDLDYVFKAARILVLSARQNGIIPDPKPEV